MLSPSKYSLRHFLRCCRDTPYHTASLTLCTLKRGAIHASRILLESLACDNCFTTITQRTAFFLRVKPESVASQAQRSLIHR